MYCSEFPACSIEQVTEMGDCAFLAIDETHHLLWVCVGVKQCHVIITVCVPFLFTYQNVIKIHLRARMTTEQWLRGGGKLRARDLACCRFVADERHRQFDDDQLCLWSRGGT